MRPAAKKPPTQGDLPSGRRSWSDGAAAGAGAGRAAEPVGEASPKGQSLTQEGPAGREGRGSQRPEALSSHATSRQQSCPIRRQRPSHRRQESRWGRRGRGRPGSEETEATPRVGITVEGRDPPDRGRRSLIAEGAALRHRCSRRGREAQWAPMAEERSPCSRTRPRTPGTQRRKGRADGATKAPAPAGLRTFRGGGAARRKHWQQVAKSRPSKALRQAQLA